MVTTAVAMRILVIEDQQRVSVLIKRGLTSERYAVDVAADGIGGLELAEAYPYDLMFRARNGLHHSRRERDMAHSSLSSRVTTFYVGILAIALLVFSAAVYFGTKTLLMRSLEQALRNSANSSVNDYVVPLN
jgi:CheY-like chemotaxis protein